MDIYQNPSMTVVFWLYSDYDDRYLRYSEEDEVYYFVSNSTLVSEGRGLTEETRNTYFGIFNSTFFIGTYKWTLAGLEHINVPVNDKAIIKPPDNNNEYENNDAEGHIVHIVHVLERKETLVLELPSAILQRFSRATKYDYLGLHGGLAYVPVIFGPMTVYVLEHTIGEINAYGLVTDSYDTVIFYGPNDHIINVLLDIELGLPDDIPQDIYRHLGVVGSIDYESIVTVGLCNNRVPNTGLQNNGVQKRINTLSDIIIICLED